MSEVKFLPYVGSKYESSRWGRRVMVLGECHYGSLGEERAEFTRDVMKALFDCNSPFDYWMSTFIKFASALSGERESRETCESIWDEVMFYNYTQRLISGPWVAPSEEQLRNAKEAFVAVLQQWCPEAVLVWGSRLYGYLPAEGHSGEPCDGVETWVYEPAAGCTVNVLRVQHPSSPFSWEKWHKVIAAFLARRK